MEKIMGEVFGRQIRLNQQDLKVVLVIDMLTKVVSKLSKVLFERKKKKIRNSDVLSICYRLFRSIKEIIEPYKEEIEMKGFLQIEDELTSELYKSEKKAVQKETIYQLMTVLKSMISTLKEKHNIEDAKFVF